jgi:hypothetical protein
LGGVIRRAALGGRFPQSELWDIKVDLAGVVLRPRLAQIFLVQCNSHRPTLLDACQMLGYCLVVKPAAALLLSPEPISDGLARLLRVHGRYDILEYAKGRRLRIAQWHRERGEVIAGSVLPPGEYF